ncbi:MAG TPA: glycoside hydrolase family 3 N-terminal domain-containing protein [Aggregatilineales bacterium]|nr:glycoside hydrolase family 3 N-terminal domain-containing protein [Aggregatilineales bacterium]
MMKHQDITLSVTERVRMLMAEMTVAEKAAQLWGIWAIALLDEQRRFAPERKRELLQHGVGQISRLGANALVLPHQVAVLANQIQRYFIEQTRLGIPVMIHEESCAGVLMRGATTFPQTIGQAATWEPALIEEMGRVLRAQLRAIGSHHALAPVLDIARDPRWGRMEETYGEDPFLVSALGTAYVRGLQGDDLKHGIAATAKHFVGYAASEGGMNWAPAHIGARELREIYATPFKAAIQAGKLATVMNAYHELDGIPCGSSKELLVDLLRGEMGFDGLVVSDYFTIAQLADYHHVTDNRSEAARLALEAGMDIELPTPDGYGAPLLQGIESGRIDITLVDACVERVLTAKFNWGLFENPFVDEGRAVEVFADPDAVTLSRRIAEQSLVLLKNDGPLLPLPKSLKRIAVIGPSADSARLLQGDYHYPSHMEQMFDPNVSPEAPTPVQDGVINWAEQLPPSVTVLQGIKRLVSPETEIVHARGCDILNPDTTGFAAAVAAARDAEVAVVVVGDKSGLALGCTTGEAIDRVSLDLPGVQQQLVEAIHATGTPTIVVITNGRALTLGWIAEHIPAVLVAWLPAEQGGAAIADALFGEFNPGGKLPVTFPRHVGQVPIFYNHKPSGGRSHWHGKYVEMSTSPLYAFGHGLSYTQFEYSDLRVTPEQTDARGVISVSFVLTNTGARAGDEVVQLYVSDPVASVTRPVIALKGFERVTLEPGARKTVTFTLDVRHLAFYDIAMRYQVEPGMIHVKVGSASNDIRLTGSFEITGESVEVEQVFFTDVTVQ